MVDTIDVHFDKQINAEELDKELKAAMPVVAGISTNAKGFVVHLTRELTVVESLQLSALVQAHDPTRVPSKPPTLEERIAKLEQEVEELKRK